jgi:DNA-binding GntR family transcriptional regulator
MSIYVNIDVVPKNISEKVYLKLREMLFNGDVVPGQKLQYQDIADICNVSRTPVKEAFQMMSKEGYLELRPQKGFYVAEIKPKEIDDLYEVRIALELAAVKNAIEHQNSVKLRKLRETIDIHADDAVKPVTRRRLITDTNVHLAIAELSENTTIYELLQLVLSKIYLNIKVENLSKVRGRFSKKEHLAIYEAIVLRNVSLARKRLYKHIIASKVNDLNAQSYLLAKG